ncbi:hypothetical protein RRSWK_06613 [Rhodopirellula sp. SWK7]|nr:hypothetical protein RRSWK_06613 [Rhodopirellula sp. SWK7]
MEVCKGQIREVPGRVAAVRCVNHRSSRANSKEGEGHLLALEETRTKTRRSTDVCAVREWSHLERRF